MAETWKVFSKLILLVFLCLLIGQIGVIYSTAEQYSWYHHLNKPDWALSVLLFPIIWTSMYVFMAIGAWDVWRRKKPGCVPALFLWSIQLILNGLWMPLFFGFHKISLIFVLTCSLLIILFVVNILFFRQSRFAGIILLFYLIWVIYINALSFMIWQLN